MIKEITNGKLELFQLLDFVFSFLRLFLLCVFCQWELWEHKNSWSSVSYEFR